MAEYKSSWFPGRKSESFYAHFDDIKWDITKQGVARRGKAKLSTSSIMLQADENLKAVRTPIGQRTDKTFKYIE
jgi:hypothetical protein